MPSPYQVAKDIGAMSAVLCGKVDQIILTGGIAYSDRVVDEIRQRVSHISGITVYAGEDELPGTGSGRAESPEGRRGSSGLLKKTKDCR